ncbi:mitochondrial escape protein 2 [Tulasnella sp. 419]|nr:mitochondrial escape protein 2 [Tulasnella sp. 419]
MSTWYYLGQAHFWRVQGRPWNEDLNRFPSNIVKIEFEGPDVHQEILYDLLRSYGRIIDITKPGPVPAGTLRSTTVTYARISSAVLARNCLHGMTISDATLSSSGAAGAPTKTRLNFTYERPIKAHAVRDWLTSHPRIVLPVVAFLLGTLTYTIFDPIRSFCVQAKVMGWFDYKQWRITRFLRRNTLDRLTFSIRAGETPAQQDSTAAENEKTDDTLGGITSPIIDPRIPSKAPTNPGEWKERREAEQAICDYLCESPNTIAILHGPQGSGKSKMLSHILSEREPERKVLTLDVAEIYKATNDSGLVTSLAKQTGYWPVFSFLSSLNNMIDLASMGLIGQKAGFSSSIETQLKEVLEVVGGALKQIVRSDDKPSQRVDNAPRQREENIEAMPVVVIRNFAIKNAGKREDLLTVLADWAAALVENRVAHVIVISDNRENMRRLAKALPSRPLASIALADADPATALSFVRGKLAAAGASPDLTTDEISWINRLGGRASDLDTLTHKVRNGSSIKDAVEDIIARGVGELRKAAFGDDEDDAKNLAWTREQAWGVLQQLAKHDEIPYAEVLLEFPFKGDESALRGMEHAELISITTIDGLPVCIKPGKPVYRFVFSRLVNDPIFHAVQDIAFNNKAIAAEEKTIQQCEDEMLKLKTIGLDTGGSIWSGWSGAAGARAAYLLGKMKASQEKLERYENEVKNLKKILAKSV